MSAHAKRPDGVRFLQYEIEYTNTQIDGLHKKFPRIPIDWIAGNHEFRLERYLARCAPELFGVFDCKVAFEVYDKPWLNWIPYGIKQYRRCGKAKLWLMHEPTSGGQVHCKGTAENVEHDTAYAHTHTVQQYTHKRKGGKRVRAYALPAACDFRAPTFSYRGPKDRWVNGFTIVCCDPKTGRYQLEVIETTDGICIYNGKLYR